MNQIEVRSREAAPASTESVARWQRPRLDRDRAVGPGVAAGLARELGIEPLFVRIAFVLLTISGGWGLVGYAALWFVMRTASPQGYLPRPKGASERHRMLGFVMVVLGLVIVGSELNRALPEALVWPSVVIAGAVGVMWANRGDSPDWSRADLLGPRMLLGLGLLLAGVAMALTLSLNMLQAIVGIGVAGLVILGVGVLLAPVISNLGTDLVDERRRRIRSEERAVMAAHLHDSVLQTLTLIQKRSGDSEVVGLARRQERELRTWLFGEKGLTPNLGFRAELESQLGEVEQVHGLPIELVVVGDTTVTEQVQGLIMATREAAINAAKHSGAPRIDVFAEVTLGDIEVFVRDQGKGFDATAIGDDRFGIRDSIVARMERIGGASTLHSEQGSGTEVELRLPLSATEDKDAP